MIQMRGIASRIAITNLDDPDDRPLGRLIGSRIEVVNLDDSAERPLRRLLGEFSSGGATSCS